MPCLSTLLSASVILCLVNKQPVLQCIIYNIWICSASATFLKAICSLNLEMMHHIFILYNQDQKIRALEQI